MKILNFITSKGFGLFVQGVMLITIIVMTLFKNDLTNNDLGSLIFFSMIYLAEEIKMRTNYYENKQKEDDSQNS